MDLVLKLEKRVSETPLECLERFRALNPEYTNVKMTYAGRLDPMASGLLIVLAGDMVHEKEEFLKLSKTYQATIVLGIESDTFDCLGITSPGFLTETTHTFQERVTELEIREKLKSFIGTYEQKYPPYSSKTVGGKQLHAIARASDISKIDLPVHTVTVLDISNIHVQEISIEEIVQDVIPKIRAVKGDFRQEEILEAWEKLKPHPVSFGNHPLLEGEGSEPILLAVSFTISVSGGTYIRAIADELGKKLGTGAVLWKLHRTKVGDFKA